MTKNSLPLILFDQDEYRRYSAEDIPSFQDRIRALIWISQLIELKTIFDLDLINSYLFLESAFEGCFLSGILRGGLTGNQDVIQNWGKSLRLPKYMEKYIKFLALFLKSKNSRTYIFPAKSKKNL